ncbi:hypothetical protein O9992_02375 [Vibrio lentus]|nr:hypothetical protein [Vibrio lentus]
MVVRAEYERVPLRSTESLEMKALAKRLKKAHRKSTPIFVPSLLQRKRVGVQYFV